MLQHAAMPLLLDVVEVLSRGTLGRIRLAHIAQAAGKLGEALATSSLTEPGDRQVRGFGEVGTREDGDPRFVEEFHGAETKWASAPKAILHAAQTYTRSKRNRAYARSRSIASSAALALKGNASSDGSYFT